MCLWGRCQSDVTVKVKPHIEFVLSSVQSRNQRAREQTETKGLRLGQRLVQVFSADVTCPHIILLALKGPAYGFLPLETKEGVESTGWCHRTEVDPSQIPSRESTSLTQTENVSRPHPFFFFFFSTCYQPVCENRTSSGIWEVLFFSFFKHFLQQYRHHGIHSFTNTKHTTTTTTTTLAAAAAWGEGGISVAGLKVASSASAILLFPATTL